jgi:hypothetical protein
MHSLPRIAAEAHIASDFARLFLLLNTRLGCPVEISRWVRDSHGLPVPVLRVPAEFVADARALGLRVEVE